MRSRAGRRLHASPHGFNAARTLAIMWGSCKIRLDLQRFPNPPHAGRRHRGHLAQPLHLPGGQAWQLPQPQFHFKAGVLAATCATFAMKRHSPCSIAIAEIANGQVGVRLSLLRWFVSQLCKWCKANPSSIAMWGRPEGGRTAASAPSAAPHCSQKAKSLPDTSRSSREAWTIPRGSSQPLTHGFQVRRLGCISIQRFLNQTRRPM